MIYIPRIDSSQPDCLTDVACALATGQLEPEFLTQVLETNTCLQAAIKLTSDILPTNGASTRIIIHRDDNDVTRFIPTEGKAKQGFIFVGVRPATSESLTVTSGTELESFLNDARKILNSANGVIVSGFDTNTGVYNVVNETSVLVWGYLKETQTEDYNPLSVINGTWVYRMFDPSQLQ